MTTEQKPKTIKLNVMLLKQSADFDQPQTFIEEYKESSVLSFNKGTLDAILYKRIGSRKHADWVKDFNAKIGGIDLKSVMPATQSHGITLFIKVRDRVFAINWGMTARHSIIDSMVDEKFGIYTVHKMVTEEVKSAQSRINETNPLNKQRQYGSTISNQQLYLSMEDNEALREIVAVNKTNLDFRKLIGKYSSLNVQFVFLPTELPCLQFLPEKLEKLLDIYESIQQEDIKQLFKGLYPLQEDNPLVEQLFGELSSHVENFYLFEPEVDFEYSRIVHFQFILGEDNHVEDDFLIENYLKHNPVITTENLRNHQIKLLNEDGRPERKWSILQCLYGEFQYNGTNYIISHGQWYEISHDKYERITQKITAITDNNFTVPDDLKSTIKKAILQFPIDKPEAKKIPKENIFNFHLCEHLGASFFDEGIKQIQIYENRFEVCDILSAENNTFYHVKTNSGISDLSHLFNQGYVSAKAYAEFKAIFLQMVNSHILDPEKHLQEDHHGSYLHYVILNKKTKDQLTFFSKMVLEDKVRTLEAMGFNVKLSWIREAI
jgi:uncharacterized protein (TIGR04141 family)